MPVSSRISRRLAGLGVIAAGLLLLSAPLSGQPYSTQIQLAINALTTGVTPFSVLRMVTSGYINFGATSGSAGYGLRDNAGTIQFKQSGGSWVSLPASGTFPTGASYLTRVAEADLSNETPLGALASGVLLNTTTTGVPTIYAGGSCTNQFVSALSGSAALTCTTVNLATMTTGIVPVANGGTGSASGVSGGVLGYTATGTIGSSAALGANQLVLGGGAGATPFSLGALGTTATVLHGNAGGLPSFGPVAAASEISGILPVANGGTGVAFFGVAGPTVARVYTFPDAAAMILTSASAVTAAQGGTGQTSYTTGDLLQATAATTLTPLAATSTGNALISGGVATASSWGKIGLSTHTSGTLPVANGGTNLTSYAVGDLLYASGATALAKLADVAAGAVLVSGGVGVAPAWSATPTLTSVTSALYTAVAATLGDIVQTLSTTATNDDVAEVVRQGRVATTDATPTAVATLPALQFYTTQIRCSVTARRTGGASGTADDGAAYVVDVALKNNSGTAVEIAAETLTVIAEDQAGWTVTTAPSGATAVISVTGAASNNIVWHATCRTWAVGT